MVYEASAVGVILTGGRSRRMGRDKATLQLDGRSLLEIGVETLRSRGLEAVVVGPHTSSGARTTREDPPGGGPVAGIDAATKLLLRDPTPPEHMIVLAADLPNIASLVDLLVIDAAECADARASVPVDTEGHPQPLAARYQLASLITALEALPRRSGAPARCLLEHLDWKRIDIPDALLQDADTPADARRHRLV